MISITTIEQAIKSRLKTELPYLKKVGSIGDWLQTKVDDLAPLTPAAFVIYEAGDYEPVGTADIVGKEMVFSIVIVVRSGSSQEKALHGTGTKKGAYAVLEDVRTCLTGQDLGLAIRSFFPVAERGLDGNQLVAIYSISFKTYCR